MIGIDSLSPYYDLGQKRANLDLFALAPSFRLVEGNLNDLDLEQILEGVEVVYHLAGQPGVRHSWSTGFVDYLTANVLATQRLLEVCRDQPSLRRFVFSSSSSVYGNDPSYPTKESQLPRPYSPYGVTKLAAVAEKAVG